MQKINEGVLTPEQYKKLSQDDLDINNIPNIVKLLLNREKNDYAVKYIGYRQFHQVVDYANGENIIKTELSDNDIKGIRRYYADCCQSTYGVQQNHLSFEYIKLYYDIEDDGFDDIRSMGVKLKRDQY